MASLSVPGPSSPQSGGRARLRFTALLDVLQPGSVLD
ncbi:MAG: hypothetical protein QOJ16_3096, partial [Acidobacteriota bacterium]|nr:hypothetical protein [Acidobacteriota bacterium]